MNKIEKYFLQQNVIKFSNIINSTHSKKIILKNPKSLKKKQNEEDNMTEISNTHTIVKELLGVEMNLFAPPSGAYNKITVSSASNLGYKTIMWTRDTIDWRDKDADLIYQRAIKNAKGGDLILMHPTEKTLEALPKIIDYFQSNGFNLTTVTQTLGNVVA